MHLFSRTEGDEWIAGAKDEKVWFGRLCASPKPIRRHNPRKALGSSKYAGMKKQTNKDVVRPNPGCENPKASKNPRQVCFSRIPPASLPWNWVVTIDGRKRFCRVMHILDQVVSMPYLKRE